MKLVIQRVKKASVEVNKRIVGQISNGFLVLIGITNQDNENTVEYMAKKVCNLRIFADDEDKMNLSIKDIKGEMLVISQFTLYADCNHGNRPNFIEAASPDKAKPLYEYFINKCREENIKVETGIFGENMQVELINDGPVTIIIEK